MPESIGNPPYHIWIQQAMTTRRGEGGQGKGNCKEEYKEEVD